MTPVPVRADVSVLVSAYQSPRTLQLVLRGLRRQTVLPREVLVADDGSSAAVATALRASAAGAPFEVFHVWQPDEGFRAARSRNNAIHRARGDLLACLDQDTVPHAGWLETHLRHAGPRRVCLARILPLTEPESGRMTEETVDSGEFEQWRDPHAWDKLRRQQVKYTGYALMRRLRLPFKPTRPSLSSGNICVCRQDLLAVNGFDEAYVGWGQEDDDLGRRLYMAGVRPIPLLTRALVTHIWHPPRHEGWRQGPNLIRYRARLTSPRCDMGLSAHPHPDVVVKRVV